MNLHLRDIDEIAAVTFISIWLLALRTNKDIAIQIPLCDAMGWRTEVARDPDRQRKQIKYVTPRSKQWT